MINEVVASLMLIFFLMLIFILLSLYVGFYFTYCLLIFTASRSFRVRTRPECPEDNLRELMWDSNPNHGTAREAKKKKKKKRPLQQKALMQHSDLWHAHKTKDWANIKGEKAGCHIGPSLPGGRDAGLWQPELEGKGLLQSRPQRPHLPPNCEQAPIC